MKKIILLCLMFLIFMIGCTQNQFCNEMEIRVKVLKINQNSVSINYKLGNEEVYDDIVLQAEAQTIMLGKRKFITLKLVTSGLHHDNKETASGKYYYGINYIGSSKIFKDYDTLLRLAQQNPSLFIWTVKDGNFIKDKEEKHVEKQVESGETKL